MTPKQLSEIRTRDQRVTEATIEILGKDSGIGQCFRDRRALLQFIQELEARLPTNHMPTLKEVKPRAAQEAWRRTALCIHDKPLADHCPQCEHDQHVRLREITDHRS